MEDLCIEQNGPLRAVVRFTCRHTDDGGQALFRSSVRLEAFRGKGWFRVSHTFVNDNLAAPFTELRSLTLRTALSAPPVAARSVLQEHDRHFVLRMAGQPVQDGRRWRAPLAWTGVDGVGMVAVRDLWQNSPLALSVDAAGVAVGLCPNVSATNYRVGGQEEDRLFFALVNGTHRLKCGVARTHELFYGFGPARAARSLAADATAFLAGPMVRAAAAVYARSGVLPEIPPRSPATADYDRWVDHAGHQFRADRSRRRAYGMLNYGDWFGERRYNWGNMEYDTPWVCLVEFLRGGQPAWYDLGRAAALHLSDVDTCHAAASPGAVGGQYSHCVGHVGGYYPDGYREMATAQGGMSFSHTWVEGLFLYAGLTGDARILQIARSTCDRMAALVDPRSYDFDNCREPGWLLIHLCAAYRATGDCRYLQTAHIVVERVAERQRPSGGWERLMVPGHCYCDPPRHRGNAAFMVGVLMAGLRRYHQVTGDARVRRCIVRAAEYLIAHHWLPERKVFRYTNCPHIWSNVEMNAQLNEGLGYAWRLSGAESIRRVLVDSFERCFSPALEDRRADLTMEVTVPHYPRRVFSVLDEGIGKMISMRMRQAPAALYDYLRAVRSGGTPREASGGR